MGQKQELATVVMEKPSQLVWSPETGPGGWELGSPLQVWEETAGDRVV